MLRGGNMALSRAFAEDDFDFLAPVFPQTEKFPFDFRREIAKERVGRGMNA